MSIKQKVAPVEFLAMWCNEGVECLVNITELETARVVAAIEGQHVTGVTSLEIMKLRARLNPQREYEIYAFSSTIPEEELREIALGENPQPFVDSIRRCGIQIYSGRSLCKKKQVIIHNACKTCSPCV